MTEDGSAIYPVNRVTGNEMLPIYTSTKQLLPSKKDICRALL
jgi:hypothetical protein